MEPGMAAWETRTIILNGELSIYYPLTLTFEDLGESANILAGK